MQQLMSTSQNPEEHSSTPWWKVPQMWLVVGGPAAVVVAAIITAVIAIRHADPVLDKSAYERDFAAAKQMDEEARKDALVKMQPAHQARNHAASPIVPERSK